MLIDLMPGSVTLKNKGSYNHYLMLGSRTVKKYWIEGVGSTRTIKEASKSYVTF